MGTVGRRASAPIVAATAVMLLLTAGCRSRAAPVTGTSCGSGFFATWPGHARDPLASCAGVVPYPTDASLEVGDVVTLSGTWGPITVDDPSVLAETTDGHTVWLRAAAPGRTEVQVTACPGPSPCPLLEVTVG